VACSDSDSSREVRKGNGALDWVAVVASQRIGPPYGLVWIQISHVARNAAKLCAYLVGAGRPQNTAQMAQ
jgi:hypothetical protein